MNTNTKILLGVISVVAVGALALSACAPAGTGRTTDSLANDLLTKYDTRLPDGKIDISGKETGVSEALRAVRSTFDQCIDSVSVELPVTDDQGRPTGETYTSTTCTQRAPTYDVYDMRAVATAADQMGTQDGFADFAEIKAVFDRFDNGSGEGSIANNGILEKEEAKNLQKNYGTGDKLLVSNKTVPYSREGFFGQNWTFGTVDDMLRQVDSQNGAGNRR